MGVECALNVALHRYCPSRHRRKAQQLSTRIAVIEDHSMVAEAMSAAIDDEPDFEIVGVYSRVSDASQHVGDIRPDVIIADLRVGLEDGLDIVAPALALDPPPRVVVLSAYDSTAEIARSMAAGASGFVRKGEPLRVLFDTIRVVASGRTVAAPAAPEGRSTRLSPRELVVLGHLASGLDTTGISEAMGVAIHTTRNQIKSLMRKLGASSRLEAVAIARSEGLV